MADVLIKNGLHAGQIHKDKTFRLARGLSTGVRGPFLLVDGTGVLGYPQRKFKMFVSGPDDFEITGPDAHLYIASSSEQDLYSSGNILSFEYEPVTNETDEEIHARITERFHILDHITLAVARGEIRGVVVTGATGVGKSHGVEAALNRDSLQDKLAFNPDADDQDIRRVRRIEGKLEFKPRYEIIKGHITAPALYRTLYEYKDPKEIVVFDDCDSALGDETSLNLFKAALDTTKRRMLSWRSNSNRGDDAPNSFEYKGTVIFITNINFEKIINEGRSKLAPHLEAIMSRCLYLDLTINSTREKLIRINHVARELGMLRKAGLEEEQINEVLEFTNTHAKEFRELSLRKLLLLADLRRTNDAYWRRMAEVTLLKR